LDLRSGNKFLFRNGIKLLLRPLAGLRGDVHDWCGLRLLSLSKQGWLWTMVGGTKTIATPEVVKIPTKKLAHRLIYMKIPGDGTHY
jgi:hypothetical protein